MKKLLLLLLMMLPMVADAQRVDKPGEPYEFFCVLKVETLYTNITVNDSQRELLDDNGKRIQFWNPANAINYMTKRGWLYVEKIDEKRFIFKKTVTSDEQAMQYLNISKK